MRKPELATNAHLLVVLTGALGDVARGLSVPSVLKRERPDLRITWLVEEKWQGVVELCSAVDTVIPFERRTPLRGVRKVREAYKQFGPFDITLDLQRHWTQVRALAASQRGLNEVCCFFAGTRVLLIVPASRYPDAYLHNELGLTDLPPKPRSFPWATP